MKVCLNSSYCNINIIILGTYEIFLIGSKMKFKFVNVCVKDP